MHLENINREVLRYSNLMHYTFATLNFFAASNIEEEMIFSLKCYAKGAIVYIQDLQWHVHSISSQAFFQLYTMLSDVCHYDDEKGFLKTQRWLDFVSFVNTVNILLKDEAKKHVTITGIPIAEEGYAINSESIHKKLQRNVIYSLCDMLDFLAFPNWEVTGEDTTPNSEKETRPALYSVIIDTVDLIDCLAEPCFDITQSIIGDREVTILLQLKKALHEVCYERYYREERGYEKGFSKTQRWVDFVNFVTMVNDILKDVIKKHTVTIND